MERFIKIFIVLAVLSYFSEKEFLQILIYLLIGVEFFLMVTKEVRRFLPVTKQGKEQSSG
jgi:hypothetical protein